VTSTVGTLTVLPDAAVSGIVGSPTSICPNTTTAYSATGVVLGGGTGVWSSSNNSIATVNSSGIVTGVNQGTCNIIFTITGGCNGTPSVQKPVTVLAPTEIQNIEADKYSWTYGCTSATLNVTATGEGTLSYQWYHNYMNITAAVGTNSSSYTVPELAGAGSHEYWVVVTAGCGDATSIKKTITILPQPANPSFDGEPYYTGPPVVFTANATSNTATFTMTAFIQNSGDVNCGDIATARLSFWYKISTATTWTKVPNGQNLPVNYVNPQTPSMGGTAAVVAQLNIGNATCETFDVLVTVSGNYTGNNDAEQSQVFITKPQPGGTISGGAKLKNNNSAGFVKGVYKSELGFFVNYTMKASKPQNPKGKVNLIVKSYHDRNGVLTNTIHSYKITSNAIASMNIAGAKATFTSKANIAEIIDCENNILSPIEGNCTMVMELEDKSACPTNNEDLVGIVVYRNAGGIWYSNNYTAQGVTAKEAIHSGSIYVSGATLPACTPPTNTNQITKSAQMETSPEVLPFNVKAYPNPTEHQFTLALEGGSNEKVQVTVYDAVGRQVKKIERNDNVSVIRFGEDLKMGAYIVEVKQGVNRKTLKLLKQ
jgi:hypothetical protein